MRQLLAELRQLLHEGLVELVTISPAEHCLRVPDLKEDTLLGRAVLRAVVVVTVIADVVPALVVDLTTALVLRVAGAALGAGVGLKSFVIVEAVAVVLLQPFCLAPLATEAPALRWQEIRVLAVEDLAAGLAARGIVRLAELRDVHLEALVAAAAEDVCLGIAVVLAAEEDVRGHVCFLL